MALVFQSFLNQNESKSFPLHDLSTRRGVGGEIIPNNFLTDAHIFLPTAFGTGVFLLAAGVSNRLVTALLGAYTGPFCSGTSSWSSLILGLPYTPIGGISLPKPIVPWRNYPITPLVEGVAGWICFGRAVTDGTFSIKFDSPEQSALLERCVCSLETPVYSIGKAHVTPLTGLIKLKGKPGTISITRKTMTIDGVPREVVAIGVDEAGGTDLLETLAGDCGHRPQALSCNKRVITSVNGVIPDCDGNVDLDFQGGIIVGEVGNGLILDFPLGLHDVCTIIDPSTTPNAPSDVCGSMAPVPEPSTSTTPEEPSDSSSSSGLPDFYCEDFEIDPPAEIEARIGVFANVAYGGGHRWETDPYAADVAYAAAADMYRPLTAYPSLITCTIRPSVGGEGHIIFAYREWPRYDPPTVLVRKTAFMLAGVDLKRSRFFIAKKIDNNATVQAFIVLADWPVPGLVVDDYAFSVTIEPYGLKEMITLDVTWGTGSYHNDYPNDLGKELQWKSLGRRAGLGAASKLFYPTGNISVSFDRGYTLFDDFGINCNGSSSCVP